MIDSSLISLRLFTAIMRAAPAQPATNLWRAAELAALIDHALPNLQSSQTILDLGCGDGGIMATLRSHLPAAATLIGLDPDPAETRLAELQNLYAQVLTTGAENMPLNDACVDAIISNSVLEHIEPLDKVLGESARVLRSGGLFIATLPSADFHRCLRGPWLPWVSRDAYLRDVDERLSHLRYWSKDEWARHLADAGLTLITTHDYLPLAVVRRWEFLSRITGGLLYHLAGRRKRPIRLQRSLGLRRMKMPKIMAQGLAWLLSLGVRRGEGPYGGLLVIAGKNSVHDAF
jgi:ubiquinone/menaquinone biosynthesis C-methylase UbiE